MPMREAENGFYFFLRPFGLIQKPKDKVVAKLQPHLPGAGPLPPSADRATTYHRAYTNSDCIELKTMA
tara:strand:+ start:29 stop:232 length:204 start_codon:yes stop_codon:yes gene_type:complete